MLGAWLMALTYIFGAAYIHIIYLYFINSWKYATSDNWIVLLVSFWFLPCVLRLLSVSLFRVSAFTLSKKPLVSALSASALFGFSPLCFGMVAPVA